VKFERDARLTLTLSPGEREQLCTLRANSLSVLANPRASSFYRVAHANLPATEYTHDGRMFLPLLGERAGVRAGVSFSN